MTNFDIVVFGTGISSRKVLSAVKSNHARIVAFADNDFNKHGKTYEDKEIVNPQRLSEMRFDYILIAIIKFPAVIRQLMEMGIPREKILSYFDMDSMNLEHFGDIVDEYRFLKDNYDLKLEKLIIKFENMPYEIVDAGERYIPKVKGIEDTMELILHSDVSISRFGDGEMKLLAGKDIGFQKASAKLANRLKEVLQGSLDKHVVGILNVFGSLSDYTEEIQNYFRTYLHEYNREFQYSLLNHEKTYYDAFITRPYISYKNREHAKNVFERFKRIWSNQSVLIVEGDRTRLGRGNDLFEQVKSCERIICPNEDAFEYYNEILHNIMQHGKDKLILLALGPTATILAYDLAKAGYRALDIGHIDLEYEWYRMGATEKVIVKNKYTNEVFGGNSSLEYQDEEYEKQIIDKICS